MICAIFGMNYSEASNLGVPIRHRLLLWNHCFTDNKSVQHHPSARKILLEQSTDVLQ